MTPISKPKKKKKKDPISIFIKRAVNQTTTSPHSPAANHPINHLNIPNECHIIRASSGTCSRFLLSSINAVSRRAGSISSATQTSTLRFSSLIPPSMLLAAPAAAAAALALSAPDVAWLLTPAAAAEAAVAAAELLLFRAIRL